MRSGTVAAPGTGRWTQIGLRMSGSTVSCLINGVQATSFTDAHPYTAGPAGIGTGGFYPVQFDDFVTS
jgi:hypothetical protein